MFARVCLSLLTEMLKKIWKDFNLFSGGGEKNLSSLRFVVWLCFNFHYYSTYNEYGDAGHGFHTSSGIKHLKQKFPSGGCLEHNVCVGGLICVILWRKWEALFFLIISVSLIVINKCVSVGQYLNLDKDHNGMLSKEELSRYGTATLTSVFLDRVFQECLTYDGEMVQSASLWDGGRFIKC